MVAKVLGMARVRGMLVVGGLWIGAVGCGVAPGGAADAEQVETAALAATSTSTLPSPTITRCGSGTFWFDGSCRDHAWVRATFGGTDGGAVLGGYGWRDKDSTAGMVLVEQFGDPASPEGVTLQMTQLAETTTLITPARAGYEIVEVRTVSVSFPAGDTVYRYEAVLQPRLVRLGTWRLRVIDWDSVTWYRSGGSLLCDPSGCSEPIASSSSVTDSEYCADVVQALENVYTAGCAAANIFGWSTVGCVGGALVTAPGAPETAGLVTVGACATGWVAGGGAGAGIAAVICPTIADLAVPDAPTQTACEAVMDAIEGALTDTSIILVEPSTTSGSGTTGASCSGTYDSVSTYESGGDCCQTTETHSCSGTYDSSGECMSSGGCSITATATVCTSGGC